MEIQEALLVVEDVFNKQKIVLREGGAVGTIRKALAEAQKPSLNTASTPLSTSVNGPRCPWCGK